MTGTGVFRARFPSYAFPLSIRSAHFPQIFDRDNGNPEVNCCYQIFHVLTVGLSEIAAITLKTRDPSPARAPFPTRAPRQTRIQRVASFTIPPSVSHLVNTPGSFHFLYISYPQFELVHLWPEQRPVQLVYFLHCLGLI